MSDSTERKVKIARRDLYVAKRRAQWVTGAWVMAAIIFALGLTLHMLGFGSDGGYVAFALFLNLPFSVPASLYAFGVAGDGPVYLCAREARWAYDDALEMHAQEVVLGSSL